MSSNLSRPINITEPRRYNVHKQEIQVSKEEIKEYVSLRETEDITKHWAYQIELFLRNYFEYCNYQLSKNQTLQYLNQIRSIYSQATYRKRLLQIRKYLRYKNLDWLDSVKIPSEPTYMPKRVTDKDINACLAYFKDSKYFLQIKALVKIGMYTGMRPSELYRLKLEDIDFENRIIQI